MMAPTKRRDDMIPGVDRLRRADELLRQADGALAAGASEVWSAMLDLPSWPAELQIKAEAIQEGLFRYGPIRVTVERMIEPERLQLRRDLLGFIELAVRFTEAG
jgi:hypothetical protein